MTNIAAAIAIEPRLPSLAAELVLMGGALACGHTAGAPRRLDARRHSAGTPAAGVAKAVQNPRQESPARRMRRGMASEGVSSGEWLLPQKQKEKAAVDGTKFTTQS